MLVDEFGMHVTGLILQAHVVVELALGTAHDRHNVHLKMLKNWTEITFTEELD